jgi:hypothetical protein
MAISIKVFKLAAARYAAATSRLLMGARSFAIKAAFRAFLIY